MAELIELVDRGIELARKAERNDLQQRLEQTKARLLDPSTRVMVVGEFKQGKSKLVNALVDAPVCAVDDDIATAIPTIVRHGDTPSAALVRSPDANGPTGGDQPLERVPVELDALVDTLSNGAIASEFTSAEVSLPRKLLEGGLSIVDSPGVGGMDSPHTLATLTLLPSATAMLMVSDASREYTDPEIEFLRKALRICPNVAGVLTKTDLYPQWREVMELNRAHLDKVRPGIPIFPVSSDLRLTAAQLDDAELKAESGFVELVGYLRKQIVGKAARLQRRAVMNDLFSTTEHLGLALQAELSALTDPEATPQLIAEMEVAKQRADDQRKRSARWQLALNDGIADLITDMEHDLRDRMRVIQRQSEDAIDETDPGPIWEQMVEWLEQRVAAAVSDTFIWTNERAGWLAEKVAEEFSDFDVQLPSLKVDDTENVLDPVEIVPMLDPGRLNPMDKFLIGLRGSYGGVLMIGLVTSIMGMALINPFSVAAGVLIGSKAYKDDKEARLRRRRNEAKGLVRRQIDDVVFQVGKQLKDRLRLVQRGTRDHFAAIAEERHRSVADSLLAAQRSANTFTTERDARIKTTQAQLQRLAAYANQIKEVQAIQRNPQEVVSA